MDNPEDVKATVDDKPMKVTKDNVDKNSPYQEKDQHSPQNKDQHSPDPIKIKLGKDLLKYYEEHFNLDDIFRVIERETFVTREFGFNRLEGGFTRNKSFAAPSHLQEYLATFPVTGAYIGSLYKDRLLPQEGRLKAITIHNTPWLGRELIFDFDMDEYDKVRVCDCKGRDICSDCWFLMQQASVIIDDTLREDFGFNKILWLYTGGRGYHAWVLDKKSFALDQDQRAAIIGYMQLVHDPKGLQKIDTLSDQAEILKRRIYAKLGKSIILNEGYTKVLKEIGFTKKRLDLAREHLLLTDLLRDIIDEIPKGKDEEFLNTVVKYIYPRIDHKVTIDIRRLIRMPGSVHIRSKNIATFVDDPYNFNPMTEAINMYDLL